MSRNELSWEETQRIDIAGRMVLNVLRNLPDSATAEMMRELIAMVVPDPADRVLFWSLDKGAPDGEASPVTVPRSPVLSGGAAAQA